MMFDNTALSLVIIGAINWLLIGLFGFDLVAFIFGAGSLLARAVYVLVALGAIVAIPMLMDSSGNVTGDM